MLERAVRVLVATVAWGPDWARGLARPHVRRPVRNCWGRRAANARHCCHTLVTMSLPWAILASTGAYERPVRLSVCRRFYCRFTPAMSGIGRSNHCRSRGPFLGAAKWGSDAPYGPTRPICLRFSCGPLARIPLVRTDLPLLQHSRLSPAARKRPTDCLSGPLELSGPR